MFRERGATLTLTMPEQVPTLLADSDRLMQVLLNLLSNAAKFVPAEGGRVEMRLTADAQGMKVEVQDNGPGVPDEQQALIFEKFRQGGDAARPAAGYWVGLADQPPDRRTFRRTPVAAFRTGAWRVLRLRTAMEPRPGPCVD